MKYLSRESLEEKLLVLQKTKEKEEFIINLKISKLQQVHFYIARKKILLLG